MKVSIWEILLAGKEVMKVAEMPKYLKYSKRAQNYRVVGDAVVALECEISIVISSLRGLRVRWDLVRYFWYNFPTCIENKFGTNHDQNIIRRFKSGTGKRI
jgi:hypothetical protein